MGDEAVFDEEGTGSDGSSLGVDQAGVGEEEGHVSRRRGLVYRSHLRDCPKREAIFSKQSYS